MNSMNSMSQGALFEEDLPDDDEAACGKAARGSVAVLLPYPVDKPYDYLLPDGLSVAFGDYVCVPLGNREVTGVVWGAGSGGISAAKLKEIIFRHDIEPMQEVTRAFIDWVAAYTLSKKGAVLKMALSVPAALYPPKPMRGFNRVEGLKVKDKALTPQRRKILDVMADGVVRMASDIAKEAGCSAGVVAAMAEKGLLEEISLFNPAPCLFPDPKGRLATLSEGQQSGADKVRKAVRLDRYSAILLDGVTGAGKTEVYFEAVAQALEKGKQVLVMLPEIALSNAFLGRFKVRFGCAPALWHSNLTPAQRRAVWRGVAQGDTRVVVGARSSLFLPYKELGLIIVDEEHDPAYKQEDGVIYHARDMAVVRAHLGGFPVVLISATPSLETMMNAWAPPAGSGRYQHLVLSSRYGGATMPEICVVDLRNDKPERQCFLSSSLVLAMQETLDKGEQVLLFLNRRGYAPLTLCRTCGHRMECPRCTAWLVEHKRSGRLHCHHCGYHEVIPKVCPSCDDSDSFAVCGPGVERIYEETKGLFPDARIMVLASDTTDSHEELREMLSTIERGDVDIVIGTQIIAKGHNFPYLTLVGVVDADLGLRGGELRAAERTYQMLHQVSGRAGRTKGKQGRVILQSWMPEHRIMKAMAGKGRDEFLAVEAAERAAAHMPPYSRLVGIIVSGREEKLVAETAKALGRNAPQGVSESGAKVQTLGPSPAPMARLRGRYRYRLLVRADKGVDVQKTVHAWISSVKVPSNVRVYIDVDPQSFL